ncbi:MAG: hypothetical protein HOO85_02960 [Methylotenera sp.]|nr:hypothetical protein [Methylotenera sp.]
MIRNMLTLIVTPILLSSCLVTPTKSDTEARRQALEQRRVACQAMRADLPSQDKYFELKGKITYDTYYRETLTREIVQFGRVDEYFQYSINSPSCGRFPLYQVASVTRSSETPSKKAVGNIKFDVALKNGQVFRTNTNVPFCLHDSKSPNVCTTLVAAAKNDPEKRSHFRFLTNDPTVKRLAEQAIDHMWIVKLEID